MDEKRKGEIALAALKIQIKRETSLKDIPNIRRDIGNLVKEPEMAAIKATPEELTSLSLELLREAFEEQMSELLIS